jgi:hypothetical protein
VLLSDPINVTLHLLPQNACFSGPYPHQDRSLLHHRHASVLLAGRATKLGVSESVLVSEIQIEE